MGEERETKFIAGAHGSLIRTSSKGLELFYDIVVLRGVYSSSPGTALRLALTGYILNELFMVPKHF